jgi:hypothetical protein
MNYSGTPLLRTPLGLLSLIGRCPDYRGKMNGNDQYLGLKVGVLMAEVSEIQRYHKNVLIILLEYSIQRN